MTVNESTRETDDPTLKVRFEIEATLGQSCHVIADDIAEAARARGIEAYAVNAQWSNPEWTPGHWGRVPLTWHERGYVEACQALAKDDPVITELLAIIQRTAR